MCHGTLEDLVLFVSERFNYFKDMALHNEMESFHPLYSSWADTNIHGMVQ